jgi:hypothetical protein
VSQYNWTYVGGGGRNYNVTLFHGKRTGHVLILLNAQVIQIDFGVRESKTYSFFIEDEFCQVHLERRGEEMYYFFEIDKKVDTPRNRERRKRDRRHLVQTLLFFGGLVVVASVVALVFQAYNKKRFEEQWAASTYSDSTMALVKVDTLPTSWLLSYSFVVGNNTYSGSAVLQVEDPAPPNLMPLEEGDEFLVRYYGDHPEFNRIVLDRPSERQLQRYFDRTLSRHLALHPDTYQPHARCSLELALELHGISGLADFFYQDSSPEHNPVHNRNSFNRLVRDPAFRQAVEERCWN